MRVQSCWRNFARLRARQSFYRLAGASMRVAIANFNNITARLVHSPRVRIDSASSLVTHWRQTERNDLIS